MEKLKDKVYYCNIDKDTALESYGKYEHQDNEYVFIFDTLNSIRVQPMPDQMINAITKALRREKFMLSYMKDALRRYFLSGVRLVLVSSLDDQRNMESIIMHNTKAKELTAYIKPASKGGARKLMFKGWKEIQTK